MNKIIIIVVLLVIVVGGGYLYMKKNSTTQQPSAPAMQQKTQSTTEKSQPSTMQKASSHAVSYGENGFEPNSITIKVGETVTWTNNDSDEMWVASNPHPTHTDYPGFDELKSVTKGQTYSFTFTKEGTWGYHNHLNPGQKGVVVVTK